MMQRKFSKIFYKAVHVLEYLIAVMTLVVLVGLLVLEIYKMLIVAIARQVIVNHESIMSNIACVLCIGGLFAIRKFLISKADLAKELSEDTPAGGNEKGNS